MLSSRARGIEIGLKERNRMIPVSTKSLSAILNIFALLVILASQSTLARSQDVQHNEHRDSSIFTIKEAGLQFEVPKGWKPETQDNGNIFVSVEDGAASVTFVVEDKYDEVVAGMKSGLKEKLTSLTSDGAAKQDTHNGMTHISESGTGQLNGAKITWSIDVLKAGKNVTLLTFGIEKVLQSHIDEYLRLVNSIKKI